MKGKSVSRGIGSRGRHLKREKIMRYESSYASINWVRFKGSLNRALRY
jgi:hypothetical protein